MNRWVAESIEKAQSRGYLDGLSEVYPINVPTLRKILADQEREIKQAFKTKNKKKLITTLLNLERFPIDDPYIGFLRRDKSALDKNPKTLSRIWDRLFIMGPRGVLEGAKKPPSSSRKMGQMFRNWLYSSYQGAVLEESDFLKKTKGLAVLKGGDAALKKFASKNLGYRGDKGLDLVIRKNNHFIIGETKFISTSGGTQDKSFRESMNFIKRGSAKTTRIAVLDGVVWIPPNPGSKKKLNLYQTVQNLNNNQVALSALLLKNFLREL